MARIVVTVGMGPWPFDRLIAAIGPLCDAHDVFAQTGTSSVRPPCQHRAFVGAEEFRARIGEADLVICHAGNTVRMVQRLGKVPIAAARRAALGEMGNDHQVHYLRHEERGGPVIALWDMADLPRLVAGHAAEQARLVRQRPVPPAASPDDIRAALDALAARLCAPGRRGRADARRRAAPSGEGGRAVTAAVNPFARHPLRRYAFAWEQLAGRHGRHLDLGCGHGDFLLALHGGTELACVGADPHAGYLAGIRRDCPDVPLQHVAVSGGLGFADAAFTSVSLLDVLEHAPDAARLLAEVHRVLAPGGILVLTVPRRHVFSVLDPDNAKFRLPRLHRAVYAARFGRRVYAERFADLSNGLRGDMSVGKHEHTNYRTAELLALLTGQGFAPVTVTGANLFWRWLQVPGLLLGGPVRGLTDRLIYADGVLFSSANLFVTARRLP